jgi:GNAT superfamily N-acetyltransferase
MSDTLPPVDIIRCGVERSLLVALTIAAMGSCEVRLSGECAELRRLMVVFEHRRKGVASALFQAALNLAGNARKLSLNWTVRKDNGAALLFYFSRGAVVFCDDSEEYWMAMIFPKDQRRRSEAYELK